jgi:hypothetical protein
VSHIVLDILLGLYNNGLGRQNSKDRVGGEGFDIPGSQMCGLERLSLFLPQLRCKVLRETRDSFVSSPSIVSGSSSFSNRVRPSGNIGQMLFLLGFGQRIA